MVRVRVPVRVRVRVRVRPLVRKRATYFSFRIKNVRYVSFNYDILKSLS